MKVKINNVIYLTEKDSLSIEDAIEERSTASFLLPDKYNHLNFSKGQAVEIFDTDDELIYGGVIDTPFKFKADGIMYHQIDCIDWHYLADKRIIAKAYENELTGNIVRDILTNILSEEGVTEGEIQDGELATETVLYYIPVSQALDVLAEKSGYWWKIDKNKKLYFVSRSTNVAPFSVNNLDMQKGSIVVEKGNPQYKNRIYIRGGHDITDPQTQNFKGDNVLQSFVVSYPISKVPTVTLNGLSQTVGIRGLDTGKQWYWSKGSNIISQDDSHSPLITTDSLAITYQGEFQIIVLSENKESVLARQSIEGAGTGYVESVIDDANVNSRNSAFELANSKLEKYSIIGKKVTFRTLKKGLEPGQLLTVNLPDYGINDAEMLIDNITINTEDGLLTWYTIHAVEGLTEGSWAKLFYHMATRGQAFVIRENIREDQILITLESFSKTWTDTEQPNIFKTLYPSNTTYPTATTYPSFKPEDRVKYIAWGNGIGASTGKLVNELGRKAITKQDGLDTDMILSTTFLNTWEGSGEITEWAWFGGYKASEIKDSGIMVDRQLRTIIKTELEGIQIDKTDSKGW